MLQTIYVIVGLIGGLLFLLLFLFPQIIRWTMKPKIEIRYSLGDLEKVGTEKIKLFTRRKVTLGIHNDCNRPLKLESVAFRRICRFQKQCLLFRYLQKTDAVPNKKWCPCSSVTDWDFTGFEQPAEEIVATFANEGKLKLTLTHNVIPKKKWREFEVPLKLRAAKPHIVEVTLSFYISFEDISPFSKVLHRILNPTSRETGYSHILIRNITIDLYKDEDLEALAPKQKDQSMFQAQLKNLESELMRFLSKKYPLSEISTEDLRKKLQETFPEADIVHSLPPNGRYRVPTMEGVEGMLKVWSKFRNICKEFLDCEQYATLLDLFVKRLIHPATPRLLKCAYKYLILSSHNPLVDLKLNLSKKTNPLLLVLLKVLLKVAINETKSSLRRRVDRIAQLARELN